MVLAFLLSLAAAQTSQETCDALRVATVQQQSRDAIKAQQYALAATQLEEAIKACPGNHSILLDLAQVRAALRDYDASIRAAQQYLVIDPGSILARTLLANAYLMAKRPKEALAESDRVLVTHPDDVIALKVKGNSAYILGDVPTSVAAFI